MSEAGSNPFLKLFSTSQIECSPSETENKPPEENSSVLKEDSESTRLSKGINRVAEDIFGISLQKDNESLNSGRVGQLVYIEEIAPAIENQDLDSLKLAVFERIVLSDPSEHLIKSKVSKNKNERLETHVIQPDCMLYLYECFRRLRNLSTRNDSILPPDNLDNIIAYVVEYVSTALRQPSLFESQNIHKQVVTLYQTEDPTELTSFINEVVQLTLSEDDKGALAEAFNPILDVVHADFARSMVMNFPRSHFTLLGSFVSIPALAELIVLHTMPKNFERGLDYSDTLFGAILNLSCLPKTVEGIIEYFERPLEAALNALDNNLWTAMGELCERFHALIEQILRGSPTLRRKVLLWFGGCLDSNLPRGRIWAVNSLGLPGAVGFVSDGFSINLASVLLRLSQPFVKDHRKLLKIDPTYPAMKVDGRKEEAMDSVGLHCLSLHHETCLQPLEQGETRPVSSVPYSFITECFFLTHRALDLSVRVLLEKTQQLYQEIGRLQRALNDRSQAREDIIETFRESMEMEMSRYLCMRCALLEPTMVRMLGQFEVATSVWLVQVILDPDGGERSSYAPLSHRPLTFPLPESVPPTLKCIPELVVESIAWYLKLVKSYSTQSLEEGGPSLMEPLLSLLLVMMGSKKRASNPHLRAQLAQSLECLLPRDQGQVPSLDPNPLGIFYRERLFVDHPHKDQIVPCLLHVFVSIEMTGEGVAFEQKFNYRRPMYTVMDYLWGIEDHRNVFKQLAHEAEIKMEEVTPPLFLIFLNLLINDAIFLLDEALSNMAQLRTLQTARDAGEWERLPLDERERNEQIFRQTVLIARFDNILGQETIHTLEYMSSEIKSIFCHPMLVERITAMLNYFLYHLVGPKKKNFKVKDQEEYNFKPAVIVKDICSIYIHLGSSSEFCSAVSKDGRSYSPQLFSLASDVLARIGGGFDIVELERVAEEVARLASIQQGDEELLAEAPEEFLDPIMSTVMLDPVTLPSSRVNIDRSTIARHLLSDQTDPFNRSPLTMNMVKSNTDLRARIEAWIAEKKSQASRSSSS